jgi:hypothetical protein
VTSAEKIESFPLQLPSSLTTDMHIESRVGEVLALPDRNSLTSTRAYALFVPFLKENVNRPSAGSYTNDKRERISGDMLLLSQTVTFPEIWKNSGTSSIIMMEPLCWLLRISVPKRGNGQSYGNLLSASSHATGQDTLSESIDWPWSCIKS